MDYIDIAVKLAQIPVAAILMAVVVFLYKKKEDVEKECHAEHKALTERYHTLVTEQVRTLNLLADKLEER